MSNTNRHKNKGKFNNGLLEKIPRDLEEKIADEELKKTVKIKLNTL